MNPSRPVYTGLQPDRHAQSHVILAEGEGTAAAVQFLTQAGLAGSVRILYATSSADEEHLPMQRSLRASAYPDVPSLLRALGGVLEQASMGTRVYVTGGTAFIGEVAHVAAGYGIRFAALRTEQRGGLARRVQCVHCKSIQQEVASETVICSQCNLRLFVRDHYSHRLNAFMGVCRDAEQSS